VQLPAAATQHHQQITGDLLVSNRMRVTSSATCGSRHAMRYLETGLSRALACFARQLLLRSCMLRFDAAIVTCSTL
jgi:hypothetical protein